MSPKCPVNLLGRDLTKLGIAVVPIRDGMRAFRVKTVDSYAAIKQENNIYCSYDLSPTRNASLINRMLRDTHAQLTQPESKMTYSKLHVTMNVLPDPQDDYITKFLTETPVVLATIDMYTDRRSFAAVTVLLPSKTEKMYKLDTVPHVSLCKREAVAWADVG